MRLPVGDGDWGLMAPDPRLVLTLGFFALTVLLLWLVARMVAPYLMALLWAGVLTLAVYPMHGWLTRVTRLGPTLAAALTAVLMTIVLLGPMVLLGTMLAGESRAAYEGLRAFMQGPGPHHLAERAARIPAELFPGLVDQGAMLVLQDRINNAGTDLLRVLADAITGAENGSLSQGSHLLLNAVIVMLAVFCFLREGPSWRRLARETIPLSPRVWDFVEMKFESTLRAVVQGTLLAAVLVAVALGIGFRVAGVPLPLFFGLITFFVAPIPFIGPLLTWLPACAWLYTHGTLTATIGLLVWGGTAIMVVDNGIKPYFIGTIVRMPVLFMLIALLGGVSAFGAIGLFLGPVLLAMTMAVGGIYREIGKRRREGDIR